MNKRHLAVAAVVLAVGVGAAYASGSFSTLPIVGEQAFCASTVTGLGASNSPYLVPPGSTQGTSSSICSQTVPPGPTALTGNEIFPADTTLANGQHPETVAVPIILTDSGAYQYSVPNATRANFTLVNPLNSLILDGSGSFTQINIALPGTTAQAALNGQQVHIITAQSITTLGITGAAGTSIDNAPTTLLISAATSNIGLTFVYAAPISTWFRSQ